MIRIMTADEAASTTITVDGALSGDGVEPVQTCCIQALSNGKPVNLYLRDVTAIDECGRTMLRNLSGEGIHLNARGLYSSYVVDEIQSAGARPPNMLHARTIHKVPSRPSGEQQRQHILRAAEEQFLATGAGATDMETIARAAHVSVEVLNRHFDIKQQLFQEVVERNKEHRLAALRQRFLSIPNLSPLELIQAMAEATVLACVGEIGNASIIAWALMEVPEFAADVYRGEIGATEVLWDCEIGTRLAGSPLRSRLTVHLAPYAVHACMAFGLWLATLRHKPATALPHARQYAGAIGDSARAILNSRSESLEPEASRVLAQRERPQ